MKRTTGRLAKPSADFFKGMTYSEIDKQGYLQYLKDAFPSLFSDKYEEKFGYKPGERPKPKLSNKKEPEFTKEFMKKLNGSTWDELDKADLLDALSGFPEMYGQKYKAKFGKYPGEKK